MPIVDHVAGIEGTEAECLNELITLECLTTGLAALAMQVSSYEKPFRGRKIFCVGFGLPDMPPGAEDLLPCLFHWFGTSLCNYARLVGFISGIHSGAFSRSATEDPANFDLIKKHCTSYVKSIPELEPVQIWRNKVFAHFALTDPRKSDNAALLDVSTMSPIVLIDGRFSVGGVVIATRGAEVEMPTWSMTSVFEALEARYWPGVKFEP
jgi:hypothetical protein